jgi:uncharacterized protein (TIGR02597 family)
MKIKASAITAAALLALAAQSASAAEAVGYNVVTVPANSDVLVSVPFNNNVEATYTVDSVAGTGITVNEALSAGTYDSSYYVRFIDGSGEGLWSTITVNGSGGLTLADDFSGYVANGDTFRVYEHHTIGSIFPDTMYGVSFTNSTQIQTYDATGAGQFKLASGSASYVAVPPLFQYAWTGSANADTVLAPGSMFLVRNGAGEELTIPVFGDVPDHSSAVVVATGARDLNIGTGFPVAMTIDDLGIGADSRQLQVYDNSASGQFKLAAGTASYVAVPPLFQYAWTGSANGSTVISGSEAFLVRLPSGDAGGKITINKPY